MRAGQWDDAWRIADAVIEARGGQRDCSLPRHLKPVWDGTPLRGRRVLVRCYHGLGDTLQFIRYAPLVAREAAALTVWAQPTLLPLLATMPGTTRLLPLHNGAPNAVWDVDVEIMELAHLFRSTPTTLPAGVPYLHPPRRAALGQPGARAVGLVWQAGDWNPDRSVPPGVLRPLAAVPGIVLHALQRGPALAELPAGLARISGADDVLEAASIMASLDLVISVDSMPAHLAGALGVPVWTLLSHDADWRWLSDRDDSPWYPTMRLFRQPRPGDWAAVIDRVVAALHEPAWRPG